MCYLVSLWASCLTLTTGTQVIIHLFFQPLPSFNLQCNLPVLLSTVFSPLSVPLLFSQPLSSTSPHRQVCLSTFLPEDLLLSHVICSCPVTWKRLFTIQSSSELLPETHSTVFFNFYHFVLWWSLSFSSSSPPESSYTPSFHVVWLDSPTTTFQSCSFFARFSSTVRACFLHRYGLFICNELLILTAWRFSCCSSWVLY